MFGSNVNSIMKTFTKAITKLEKLKDKEEVKAGLLQRELVTIKANRIKSVLSARDIYLTEIKRANTAAVEQEVETEDKKDVAMDEMIRSGNAIIALKKLTGDK